MYYNHFSTVNWVKLDVSMKQKHTLNCEECNISCFEIHAKYPSTAPKYEEDRNKNIVHAVENVVKSHKISRGACKELTTNLNNTLDDSFTKHFGLSFPESFKKCYKLENRRSYEEKRKDKCANIRETVSKLNADHKSTAVDRLYGSRRSLAGWNADRKKKSFESVPDAINRTMAEKLKVESGVKKMKNHIGNFDYYDIDKQSLEAEASSWTDENLKLCGNN